VGGTGLRMERGSSNCPPGVVPLRGLGWFQSGSAREGSIGESSESEPLSSEEKEMRDSSIRSMVLLKYCIVRRQGQRPSTRDGDLAMRRRVVAMSNVRCEEVGDYWK
jgi:hypothetical protein